MGQAHPTPFDDINDMLDLLLTRLRMILGQNFIGLYLFGSLVVGDFAYENSDIDLMVALSSDLDEQEFEHLKFMHRDVVNYNKQWDNRIEIGYIAVEKLKAPHANYKIALISPDEPFHFKEAGNDWFINRYVLRENGIALYGPSPKAIIAPISREEQMQNVQENAREWREWITRTEIIRPRKYQALMILTMCRELYRAKHDGEVVSKKAAAQWVQKELPEWSPLIECAFMWREAWREVDVDSDATLPEVLGFVHWVLEKNGG